MESNDKFKSLKDFITGLYSLGGVPLLLIGLGALNTIVPDLTGYSNQDQLLISLFLFVTGLFTWVLSTYIALRRWEVSMKIAAEQDREIIKNVCEILKTADSAAFKSKVQDLKTFLPDLGVRQDTIAMSASENPGTQVQKPTT